jgi:tripartite-type tricarboxylate transporter receptor subunit TctC
MVGKSRRSSQCVALLAAVFLCGVGIDSAAEPFSSARVAVYFSPSGGATDAVVREVHAATQQILVQPPRSS